MFPEFSEQDESGRGNIRFRMAEHTLWIYSRVCLVLFLFFAAWLLERQIKEFMSLQGIEEIIKRENEKLTKEYDTYSGIRLLVAKTRNSINDNLENAKQLNTPPSRDIFDALRVRWSTREVVLERNLESIIPGFMRACDKALTMQEDLIKSKSSIKNSDMERRLLAKINLITKLAEDVTISIGNEINRLKKGSEAR